MRNRYPGPCYRCGNTVEKGDGHFERYNGRWRVIHETCVREQRVEKGQYVETGGSKPHREGR